MAVKFQDIIALPLTRDDILWAIDKALSNNFIDNLRNRHLHVQFDSKLRGYIGELAFKNWLISNDISILKTNNFNFQKGLDVDIEVLKNNQKIGLELKTSMIPDKDKTIENVLLNRDIKLIKRRNQTIDQLHGDVHIQLVFKQLANAKDQWLMAQNIDFESENLPLIYHQTAAWRYLTDTFFVGWIDKTTLVEHYAKSGKEQFWSFKNAQRSFWNCRLNDLAKPPIEVINYLKF